MRLYLPLIALAVLLTAHAAEVYFGNGCYFYHQHEMVTRLEQGLLNRTHAEITSITGYAGGNYSSTLCYHNSNNTADYGELGHAEAVSVVLPESWIPKALEVYFTTFSEVYAGSGLWARRDIYDLGAEYRALIGVPGGLNGKWGDALELANVHSMNLLPGKGSEADTLSKNAVYVMDSLHFPFVQAEVCMQFQDDRASKKFPAEYHALTKVLLSSGRLQQTTCPPNYIC